MSKLGFKFKLGTVSADSFLFFMVFLLVPILWSMLQIVPWHGGSWVLVLFGTVALWVSVVGLPSSVV